MKSATNFTAEQLTTGNYYVFRIRKTNQAGHSKWVETVAICCVDGGIVSPQINLTENITSPVVVQEGAPIDIGVHYKGKPMPTIIWTKINRDTNTEEAVESYIMIENVQEKSTFKIDHALSKDSGKYRMKLTVLDITVDALIDLQVSRKCMYMYRGRTRNLTTS